MVEPATFSVLSAPCCDDCCPGGGGRTCFGMRAAQAAASSAVAIGFAGGAGFAAGAANFAGASGAFGSVAASFAAGAAGASRAAVARRLSCGVEGLLEGLLLAAQLLCDEVVVAAEFRDRSLQEGARVFEDRLRQMGACVAASRGPGH